MQAAAEDLVVVEKLVGLIKHGTLRATKRFPSHYVKDGKLAPSPNECLRCALEAVLREGGDLQALLDEIPEREGDFAWLVKADA